MFLFLGGFGRRNLNIIVKWLSKKDIKDQYPGIIYDHVSFSFWFQTSEREIDSMLICFCINYECVCGVYWSMFFFYYLLVAVNLCLCPTSVRCGVCLLCGFWQIGKTGQDIFGNNFDSSLVNQPNNCIRQMDNQCFQLVAILGGTSNKKRDAH